MAPNARVLLIQVAQPASGRRILDANRSRRLTTPQTLRPSTIGRWRNPFRSIELFTLALFAVVALMKVYANSPTHSVHVSASWFNPFDLSWGSLVDGVLLGIFIYWGWDSGVAVNEESRDRHRGPGKAAVISTLILLVIYLVVTVAAQSYHGYHASSQATRPT